MKYFYTTIIFISILESCTNKKFEPINLTSTNVFVCDDNGTCTLLNSKNGQVIWQYKTEKFIISSPTFYQNILYISTSENSDYSKIIAIDYITGLKLWEFKTEIYNVSSPLVVEGRLYSVSYPYNSIVNSINNNGKLYCINAITGKLIWETVSNKFKDSSPTYFKGNIYVLGDDGLEIFNAVNGNNNKGFRIQKPLSNREAIDINGVDKYHSSPAVVNDICYYIFKDNFIAFNLITKSSKSYRVENSYRNTSSPTIKDNIAYFTSGNSLIALNINTFTEKWIFKFPEGNYSIDTSPFATDEFVYITHRDGTFAIDTKTGIEKWKNESYITSSTNVYENIVFVASGESLKALNSSDGNIIWNFKMKSEYLGYLPSPLIINEKREAFHSSISGARH